MPFDPTERVPIGSRGVVVTRLAFGCAPIGGLFQAVTDAAAAAVLERAWDLGIRAFDVAPLYGYGAAERLLGEFLRDRPRDDFVVSTKVGRLVRTVGSIPAGAEVDHQVLDGHPDAYYAGIGERRMVFDYSADGVRRSIDESLERLGLDRVDIVLIHDPDDHWQAALDGAYPALHRLREDGVVRAIGMGMNQAAMLARFAELTEPDVFLLAGRYTLFDQDALSTVLPRCVEHRIAVLIGGVMNSGLLADPRPGTHLDYAPAEDWAIARARRLGEICARHGVALRAAAMQFPLAHPAVRGLIAGTRRVEHLEEYHESMRLAIPPGMWHELRDAGLLPPDAPVPA
ncbi:MAG TPA: aldo/keto reductase [Candidatus Limnocylindrales bacterium]